jgi:hypothetical protein
VESIIIVIALFAAVIIVVAVAFRHRIRASSKGLGNTRMEVDASNPVPWPGGRIKEARSNRGGLAKTDYSLPNIF